MNCESVRQLISPLLDNELEAVQKAEVEQHMNTCIGCAELHFQYSQLVSHVQADAPYYSAPEELRYRIVMALERTAGKGERLRPAWSWMALAAAAGFLLALSLFFGKSLVTRHTETREADLLAQEVVASHVRSLMASHLFDVRSSDQHTVKPWFAGKIDFSPTVKDLTAQGYELIGGRLDYLDSRPIAALVYQRRQHIINLFVWPAPQDKADQTKADQTTLTLNGFHLVRWHTAGLFYWAVSDLNMAELREFARSYAE